MADVNVLDLTQATPGTDDSLILFDRNTGEAKSTRYDTLKTSVLTSKFGDSSPTDGQELSYDPATGKYKNTSQIASLKETLAQQINYNGAKNFVKLGVSAVSKVVNGITFVVNSDNSITASTGSSGATAATWFEVSDALTLEAGKYFFTGQPKGVTGISLYLGSAFTGSDIYDTGGYGATFTITEQKTGKLFIKIDSGKVLTTPITFKPLIQLASNTDHTYVPYAKSNKELTDILNQNILFSINYAVQSANTWENAGSFTIDEPMLICARGGYSNARCLGIAVGGQSVNGAVMLSESPDSGSLQTVGILNPGTYNVWVKYATASTNTVRIAKVLNINFTF